MGRGERRAHEEVNDDAGPSDEVRDSNFFTVTNFKQMKVKKFNTIGSDHTVQFANTFANLELLEYHTRLHEIFESLLETATEGVALHNQARFVLRSP